MPQAAAAARQESQDAQAGPGGYTRSSERQGPPRAVQRAAAAVAANPGKSGGGDADVALLDGLHQPGAERDGRALQGPITPPCGICMLPGVEAWPRLGTSYLCYQSNCLARFL